MNKIRLIKIYELRGKVHPIEQYIIDILDGIEEVTYDYHIKYRKEGVYYFGYYLLTNKILLYPSIYYKFNCSYIETNDVMKYLLEKHLNITINDFI